MDRSIGLDIFVSARLTAGRMEALYRRFAPLVCRFSETLRSLRYVYASDY